MQINEWEEKKKELISGKFPIDFIKKTLHECKSQGIDTRMKNIYFDTAPGHEVNKEYHHAQRIRWGTFEKDYYYDYCPTCNKILQEVGVIFDNKNNLCFSNVFYKINKDGDAKVGIYTKDTLLEELNSTKIE